MSVVSLFPSATELAAVIRPDRFGEPDEKVRRVDPAAT